MNWFYHASIKKKKSYILNFQELNKIDVFVVANKNFVFSPLIFWRVSSVLNFTKRSVKIQMYESKYYLSFVDNTNFEMNYYQKLFIYGEGGENYFKLYKLTSRWKKKKVYTIKFHLCCPQWLYLKYLINSNYQVFKGWRLWIYSNLTISHILSNVMELNKIISFFSLIYKSNLWAQIRLLKLYLSVVWAQCFTDQTVEPISLKLFYIYWPYSGYFFFSYFLLFSFATIIGL